MIHLIQCMCPQRHCILAMGFDPQDMAVVEAEHLFQEQVERWIGLKIVNRRCVMCGDVAVELHYETETTVFRTMDEAAIPGSCAGDAAPDGGNDESE